jgi:predicted NAD-dependent protein-ADP-ribosyltransferase YbiA (DUF1768 family)
MRVRLTTQRVVIVPDSVDDRDLIERLMVERNGHAFRAFPSGGAAVLEPIGPYSEVYRVPINVTSRHRDPSIRLISNFAATPFELDGEEYASVEGFWQSLRVTSRSERRRIAALTGGAAKRAGEEIGAPEVVSYGGHELVWGSPEHWDLMRRACRAKFAQVEEARSALLATRPRPLVHRMRRDSRSIPGAIMAGIWIGLRDEFALRERREHFAPSQV